MEDVQKWVLRREKHGYFLQPVDICKIADGIARAAGTRYCVFKIAESSIQLLWFAVLCKAGWDNLKPYLPSIRHKLFDHFETLNTKATREKDVKKKDDIIVALRAKEEKLQEESSTKDQELAHIRNQIQELSTKLASEMSSKISSNESSVDNTSKRNRPMKVAEEYQLACSNEWLEAKYILDQCASKEKFEFEDYKRLEILCIIIKVSEEVAQELHKSLIEKVTNLVHDPSGFDVKAGARLENTEDFSIDWPDETENRRSDNKQSRPKLTAELDNSIGDVLRSDADFVNMDAVEQTVCQNIHAMFNDHSKEKYKTVWNLCKTTEGIQKYISKIARIAWKMVIQHPQMTFDHSTTWKGDTYQDIYSGSVDPYIHEDHRIVVVFPMLYHEKKLMAKGKILRVAN